MKQMIFHIPFAIDPDRHSASQIRPIQMYKAFIEIGYEVFTIWGNQSERQSQFLKLKDKFDKGERFDFLYSESSTMPQMLTEKHHLPTNPFLEYKIFKMVKSQNIPIGLFYRDIHWMFDQYSKETSFLTRSFAKFFYYSDLIFYKYLVDLIFLPSEEMKKFLPLSLQRKNMDFLPPGHSVKNQGVRVFSGLNRCMYVGGIKPPLYDLHLLDTLNFPIQVICRSDEWKLMKEIYNWGPNIGIFHSSGEELEKFYNSNDIFLLIWKPNPYLDFAMPMKIFEAIGYHIPIITNNGTLVSEFVKSNNIGWVFNNESELAEILNQIDITYQDKVKQLETISYKHHWTFRALKVQEKLLQ